MAVIDGLIHSDAGAMIRAAFVEVPVSLFATATLIALVTAALEVSDGLSAAFLGGPLDGTSFTAAFGQPDAVIKAGLLRPLLVIVFVLGGLAVWVELVIRASLIYLLVMLAPLFLAARIWPAAKRSWGWLVELGVALIAAKPVIAVALALGVAALGHGPTDGSVGEQVGANVAGMLTAATLMLLAVFSPFVILKLVRAVKAAVLAQGIRSGPARAGMAAAQAGYFRWMLTGSSGGSGPQGGGSTGGGSESAPTAPTAPTASAASGGSAAQGRGAAHGSGRNGGAANAAMGQRGGASSAASTGGTASGRSSGMPSQSGTGSAAGAAGSANGSSTSQLSPGRGRGAAPTGGTRTQSPANGGAGGSSEGGDPPANAAAGGRAAARSAHPSGRTASNANGSGGSSGTASPGGSAPGSSSPTGDAPKASSPASSGGSPSVSAPRMPDAPAAAAAAPATDEWGEVGE